MDIQPLKPTTRLMVLMRLIYSIFKTFILIFVNIYLWQAGKSIQAVALFNIFNYLAATGSFYVANAVARRNSRYNYILSSLAFIFAFSLTAWHGDDVASYAILIGILGGCGDGFFFFNLNTFQADELDKDEMDRFMSIIGGLNKASAIITPVISGVIIEQLGFLAMIYTLLVLLVVQLFLSLKMPAKRIEGMGRFSFRRMFERTRYAGILWTNTTKAPYQQFTNMANSVFLFSLMTSESVIGALNSVFAVVSILMFILYRRVLRHVERRRAVWWGAAVSTLIILMLLRPSFTTFILFGILSGFGNAFYNTPMVGVQLHSAKVHSDGQTGMLGNLMHRVVMMNIGRVGFFLLIYLFYEDFTSPIFTILLVFNLISPILTYHLARREI